MFDRISQILEEKLQASWTLSEIAWANMSYIPKQDVPFIRQSITQTTSDRINVGDVGLYRDYGLMIIQVFTPRRKGTRENAVLASSVAALFREYSHDGLYCGAPFVEVVGESKEWYQSNVIVDYYYDAC